MSNRAVGADFGCKLRLAKDASNGSRTHRAHDRCSRHIGILVALVLCLARPAPAAPPPDADPSLAPWFNSLRQPWTNALCCSIADCRPVDSRLNGEHYEALIEGQWREVPDHLILNRSDNPTGRAVVCWTPQVGILCFIRAPES
jgi:hypothetical protein